MKGLQKTSDCTAVSFNAFEKPLTKGQKMLLQLLIERQRAGEPVTKEDIKETYLNALYPNRMYEGRVYKYDPSTNTGRWVYEMIDRSTEYGTQSRAGAWFKMNLASCIIKGKIIAIPVIDL